MYCFFASLDGIVREKLQYFLLCAIDIALVDSYANQCGNDTFGYREYMNGSIGCTAVKITLITVAP